MGPLVNQLQRYLGHICFSVSSGRLRLGQPQSLGVVIWSLFCSQREVPHFSRDTAGEPITVATGVDTEGGRVMEMILEEEEKCSEKMKRDLPYNKSGTVLKQSLLKSTGNTYYIPI